jgi:hypothetical protein
MGFEPMTNRVTDYYSTTELYYPHTITICNKKIIITIGLEPINPKKDSGF